MIILIIYMSVSVSDCELCCVSKDVRMHDITPATGVLDITRQLSMIADNCINFTTDTSQSQSLSGD